MNQGGDISVGRPPSPRPSPPGRGRTICPPAACTDFRGISPGSWAGGSIVNRGVIILGGVFANMVTSIEGKDSMKREGLRVVSGNRDARKLASLCERMWLRLNDLTQGRPSGSRANPGLCSQTPWGFPRGQRQLNPPLKWWNISNVPVARNLPTRRDDCPVAFTRQGPSEIGMMRLRIAVMNEVAGSARTRTCCGWSFRHSRDPFLI